MGVPLSGSLPLLLDYFPDCIFEGEDVHIAEDAWGVVIVPSVDIETG